MKHPPKTCSFSGSIQRAYPSAGNAKEAIWVRCLKSHLQPVLCIIWHTPETTVLVRQHYQCICKHDRFPFIAKAHYSAMTFFELEAADISSLNDADLRQLVARLCEAELSQQGMPTSCVNWGGAQEAADGGLDVSIQGASRISSPNFVPRERTGFQVKKHTMGKSACKNEMQENGQPKAVISNLALDGGAYIIVSGKDDCTDKMLSDRLDGMRAAVDSLDASAQIHLNFYGRDRLAAWLRQHPSVALWVRARLGKPLAGWRPYERWAATPPDHDDQYLVDDYPCVTDTNSNDKEPQKILEGIRLARAKLGAPGSAVRITGLSGVGKTRFAQAIFEHEVGEGALSQSDVIYADLGSDLKPTASELLTYLIANGFASYVILDNCPPDVHRELVKQARSGRAKLRLLTIEYDISDDKPEETNVIHLEPSSEAVVSRLLLGRFPQLGQINAERIAEFAGGNARIGLALASRVDTDETLTNFSDEALFERLFSQRKGNSSELLQQAEVLALVYSFNVSSKVYGNELETLGSVAGLNRQSLYKGQAELLRRQLAQQRGDWRAVLPHALANRLAKRALQNFSLDDINSVLFKEENIRLLVSCAHRLGYLHDFDPAQKLALSWIKVDAPLGNFASCDGHYMTVLKYVAPVFPDVVLRAIEEAALDPAFASRSNKNYGQFVRILCHLAYEEDAFERAAIVILKFAENEKPGEKNNGIVSQFQQLFSLYLSGTEASPARRQGFVRELINSGNVRHREIADALLESALKSHHWSRLGSFHFGARKRGPGWEPKNQEELNMWYVGFGELVVPCLNSKDVHEKDWAKSVLAGHCNSLWLVERGFDLLEQVVFAHGQRGDWPDMWISIKRQLHYHSASMSQEVVERLVHLEKLAAPSNINAEIRSYVLTDPWGHAEIRNGDIQENMDRMREKVMGLGEAVVTDLEFIGNLSTEFWEKRNTSLIWFGEGLAKGGGNVVIFNALVESFKRSKSSRRNPILLGAFIRGVHYLTPVEAREILERVLNVAELKPHWVYFLSVVPIDSWGFENLVRLAKSGEIDAWQFRQLGYGQAHERISDEELASLIFSINELEGGYLSVIELLYMRFFEVTPQRYLENAAIVSAARYTVLRLVLAHRSELGHLPEHELGVVFAMGLDVSAPVSEVKKIIDILLEGIASYRLYVHDLSSLISVLIKNHTEILLDAVFCENEEESRIAAWIFMDRFGRASTSLNGASLDRLMAWCAGDQGRLQNAAAVVSPYVELDSVESSDDCPKIMVLSDHIMAILEAAADKLAIVDVIFQGISPSSWSGSRASIIEVRANAFEELVKYPDVIVQSQVKLKLPIIRKKIDYEREREADEQNMREQRFE
nr:hypothetical protein [Delftia acidovorans]